MQKSHRSTPRPGRDFHHGHKNFLDETQKKAHIEKETIDEIDYILI